MSMTGRKKYKCLIVSPFGFDTRVLQKVLSARGISWRHVVDLPSNRPILQDIRAALKTTDFVCGVVTSDLPTSNVLFELGFAQGLGLPLLVFAERGAGAPEFFNDLTCFFVLPQSETIVGQHLDTFLRYTLERPPQESKPRDDAASAASMSAPRIEKGPKAPDVSWVQTELADLPTSSDRGRYLEDIVLRLLKEAGATVTVSHQTDSGVEMGLWAEPLEQSIGNPALLEIRSSLSRDSVSFAIDQIRAEAKLSGGGCGILVYMSPEHVDLSGLLKKAKDALPLVFLFSMQEFVSLIGRRELFKEIAKQRNRAAHGLF